MTLRFASFELDDEQLELRRSGTLVKVQPRVLEVLLFLVTHRDHLVTKDELRAGVWKDMSVSEAALSQAIRQVRSALGEDPTAPQFIETVRGKGFRFRGQLSELPVQGDGSPRSRRLRPFFGRQLETARLQLASGEARAGRGNVVLVHGPPGVGKTRLAQWFARHQRDAGSEVCWGGCREGQSAPPFWPWPELLHRYAETREVAALELLAQGIEHDLAAVAPELREALGVASGGTRDESQERAQSVIGAIAGFLRRAAEQAPLTLVLEDLHLADDAALRVLEVLAGEIGATQLVILGTVRSAEGASRAVLASAIEGLLSHTQTLALEGLAVGDVRQWLTSAAPSPLSEAVVDAIHFSTEGLPLLVETLVESLATSGAAALAKDADKELGPSGRVKEILGRRLHRLDEPTRRLLRIAAVCGEEFPTAVLATVTDKPANTTLALLEQAQERGVLKLASAGSLRFAHALHRDLLYQELEASERRQLHAAFGRAFADQLGQHPETIVETAHHFLEARPHADASETVHYAERAAEWARARHAYARAAGYYERALAVLDLEPAEPHQYAELLLALAHAQFVAGAVDAAIATLERIFELTRAHGYYDLFCRAICTWFQLRRESSIMDPVFHARIAEALARVQQKDSVFAQLQVVRAMSTIFTSPIRERVAWIQEALALTREGIDLRPRMEVLRGALMCYTNFTDGTSELSIAEEMLKLSVALRSPENELVARQWRVNAVLALGRGADYQQEVATHNQRAAVAPSPQAAWMADVLAAGQHFLAGSLSESERVARHAGKVGSDLVGLVGFVHMLSQLLQIGLELAGDEARRILSEVVEGGNRVLALAPNYQAYIPVIARARMYCESADSAREYLARVTSPTYVTVDRLDRGYLPHLATVADLACSQNDVAAAGVIMSLFDGYAGWHAVTGTGSVYFGPVSYSLGRLSLTCGRAEDAQRQLALAIHESERAGSVIYRAWSEYYLAQALPAGEAPQKPSLVESARRAAQRYGLGRLLATLESDHTVHS